MNESRQHIPVLLNAVLENLAVSPGAIMIDATVGAGGRAAALLARAGDGGHLLGIDQDPAALVIAEARLAAYQKRVTLVHARFDRLTALAAATDITAVDAILMDLGVSSMHLDDPARGFSFMRDGPLDMRMNPEGDGPTAADLVNR